MIIVGIDPGKTGAVAVYTPVQGRRHDLCWTVHDCPTVKVKVNGVMKDMPAPNLMANILRGLSAREAVHVFIEKVGPMPKQGVTSMFNFGMNFGQWQGIVAAFGGAWTLVTPQRWKKSMMVGMPKKVKDAARIRAIQLFPEMSDQLARKKDIGRADALLIGEYGRIHMATGW